MREDIIYSKPNIGSSLCMSFTGGVFVLSVDWDNWDMGDISRKGTSSFLFNNGFCCSWPMTVGNGILDTSIVNVEFLCIKHFPI
jgi:hypothetical protein